jgi:hypothetical protein
MFHTLRAATLVAATLASSAALADPQSTRAPWLEPDDTSATVELLRVADRSTDRFADLGVDHAGRIVGWPPGGSDILINNPAACGPVDTGLSLPAL